MSRRERIIGRARARVAFARSGVRPGGGASNPGRLLQIESLGELEIGPGLQVWGTQFASQLAVGPKGKLVIGARVFVNQGTSIYAAESITIGDNTRIGDLVSIYDTNFHPIGPTQATRVAPVVIGRNVWLGRGATILPGVTIGDHAVVGAGSVVSRDVPASTVVAGNPAVHVRDIEGTTDDWKRP